MNAETVLEFDASCHSVDAIQRAAYRYSDRLSAEIACVGDQITCRLFNVDEAPLLSDAVVSDFRNEVLDQVLRERIRRETESVRNLVLAYAFSNTAVVEPD